MRRGGAGGAVWLAFLLVLGNWPPAVLAEHPAPPAPPPPPAGHSPAPRAMPYPTAPDSCRRCYVQTQFLAKLQSLPVENDRVEVRRGVGVFYTTEKPKYIAPIRNLVTYTIDGLHQVAEHPEKARLCLNCQRDYRIYSKLDHEIVPLQHGVLVLITSPDDEAVDIIKRWYLPRRNFIDMEEFQRQMEELRKETEKLRVNGGR